MGLVLGRGQAPHLNPEDPLSTGRKKQTDELTTPNPLNMVPVSVLQ